MKLCKDCKHISSIDEFTGWGMNLMIKSKKVCVRDNNISPVNGDPIEWLDPYLERKDYPTTCGKNGRYWEAK